MYPGTHAATTPDKPAYIMGTSGQVVTYKELDHRSNQLAQLFRASGLRRGDHVAFMLENHPRYFELAWAAQRAGLYYTAISSRLTREETEYIVNDSEAKVFIASAHTRDVAEAVVASTPGVQVRLMLDGTADGYEPYEDRLGEHPAERVPDESQGADMLYSSGTTGRPKGVLRALPEGAPDQPSGVAALGQMLYGFTPDSVYLSPAPLYHAAPLRFSMGVQQIGGTVIVMEHFDPVDFLRLVDGHEVTHTQVVPTMFVRMLKLPDEERHRYDVSSLQVCIHAAAPCPIPVKQQMIEWWGPVVYEYYAGTEGNGFCAISSQEWLEHKGSVGKPLLGELHIVGDDGTEVPARTEGIVYFGGGAADFEYHNDPDKTAQSRHPEGWSTLGDVGYVDEEGYLYLTDRKAYMIISGGVNIYPQEAENVLTMHPKILDVAVIGVPNEDFGEEVKAVVQLIDPADASPALGRELIEYCKEHLADIKCPRTVDFRDELPRHPTGKLYKRLLRDEYWKGHDSRLV